MEKLGEKVFEDPDGSECEKTKETITKTPLKYIFQEANSSLLPFGMAWFHFASTVYDVIRKISEFG
jgi:hypothetical protein